MAEFQKKGRRKTGERIFSAENALLSLARPQTIFDFDSGAIGREELAFISVDEVGRGCLAGPVVVCTTLWGSQDRTDQLEAWYPRLRDSKKLSIVKRDQLFREFLQHELLTGGWQTPPVLHLECNAGSAKPLAAQSTLSLRTPASVMKFDGGDIEKAIASGRSKDVQAVRMKAASIGAASAQEIDTYGIIPALGLAASRALAALPSKTEAAVIFFDGNRPLALPSPWCALPQALVVKGDDHLKSISASSVIAKVVRDRWMESYSESFPDFGFNENRGYGTEFHREALSRLGPSPLHRISFLKNLCPQLSP
jgi:ribonuclease HII